MVFLELKYLNPSKVMKRLNSNDFWQFLTIILLVAIPCILYQGKWLRSCKLAYQNSISVCMDSLHKYKVADSLNAIHISNIELSLKQYKQLRAEDAKLIKQLKADKLTSVVKPETIIKYKIKTQLKDSIIYKDTVKAINYHDSWNSVTGYFTKDSAKLNIQSKDELLITKSVERKKFLFFKLNPKWFGYRKLQLNIISKNPNCSINNVEWVEIK